jgi:hypothetical protein
MLLREGDVDRLRALHGRRGASDVVRDLIIKHLKRVDDNVDQKISTEHIKAEDLV